MAELQRRHVSNLVPKDPRMLTILLLVVCVVNSATMGYDSSMMNGLNIIPQYKDYFHLNTATTGLNTASNWMGSIIGGFFIQPIPDQFGRKPAILIAALVCCVGCIIQTAAQNIAMFVVGRIIVGAGSQLSSGAAPTLIGELLPATHRGAVLGFFFSCYYVGSLVAAGINYRSADIASTWAWRLPSVIVCVPSLLCIAALPFTPESPRWLIANGKEDEALETLAIVHGHSDLQGEEVQHVYHGIRVALKQEKEQYSTKAYTELITGKANLHRLAIILSFAFMNETLGNFVISFYLGNLLTTAGLTNTTSQLQVNIALSCWCFIVACIGSYLLDIIGRRTQTLWSIVGMIISLFIIAALTKAFGASTNENGINATIAFVFLFQGLYSVAITPMTSLYPTEVMPYRIRNAGIAIFRITECSFGLIYSFAMNYAMEDLGWKFYIVNACYDVVFLAAVYFIWVETARVPLEEVALKFGDVDPNVLIDGVGVSRENSNRRSAEIGDVGEGKKRPIEGVHSVSAERL